MCPRPAATRPALDLESQLLPPGAVYSMLRSDLSASEAILRDTPTRHHKGPHPPRGSASQSAADTLFATLSADMSPLALRPRDPTHMHAQCEAWMDCLQHQYAPSTNLADRSHMKKWTAHCADMGTPPLRSDIAANIGVDLAGHKREVFHVHWRDEVPSHDVSQVQRGRVRPAPVSTECSAGGPSGDASLWYNTTQHKNAASHPEEPPSEVHSVARPAAPDATEGSSHAAIHCTKGAAGYQRSIKLAATHVLAGCPRLAQQLGHAR